MASPHFIFRMEEAPDGVKPGEIYQIADSDLASRLSFFLWGAPPDEELVRLADDGDLSDDREARKTGAPYDFGSEARHSQPDLPASGFVYRI